MRYIDPLRIKMLMILFFATGVVGMYIGLTYAPASMVMIITFMGVVNFGLGAFFAYLFLTQEKRLTDKEKRMKRRRKRHTKDRDGEDNKP